MKPLIVGVGNRWRGDDGVGARAIDAVDAIAASDRIGFDLLELDGEAARLADAWAGRPSVVVVDAVRTGAPAGTIHRLDGADSIPDALPDASTHAGGVAAAVALSRALGTLPGRLVVIGVEPALTTHGTELSPVVAARLDEVVDLAVREVGRTCV